MAVRRLLIVTYYFPPSAAVAAHRMIGLVRHLPAFSWETIVVAPPRVAGEPDDPALLAQVPSTAPVIHVPFPRGLLGKVSGRLAPFARWVPGAIRACERIMGEQAPDAVYTSSPPGCVHYVGLYLKRRYGLPWTVCLRDPWIANRRSEIALPYLQQMEIPWERRVMRWADAV
ncbi:MAG: hypothetical protein HY040_18530, partial [Planctomycetes bacterium]|nr:hypothetical protein [Planctomycetota bacterium]